MAIRVWRMQVELPIPGEERQYTLNVFGGFFGGMKRLRATLGCGVDWVDCGEIERGNWALVQEHSVEAPDMVLDAEVIATIGKWSHQMVTLLQIGEGLKDCEGDGTFLEQTDEITRLCNGRMKDQLLPILQNIAEKVGEFAEVGDQEFGPKQLEWRRNYQLNLARFPLHHFGPHAKCLSCMIESPYTSIEAWTEYCENESRVVEGFMSSMGCELCKNCQPGIRYDFHWLNPMGSTEVLQHCVVCEACYMYQATGEPPKEEFL